MTQRFTKVTMIILAVMAGMFAVASIVFQIKSEINKEWYYGLVVAVTLIVLTYGFGKRLKWSAYLYVLVLVIINTKNAFDGSWDWSPLHLIPVFVLIILALNFKNLK